MYSKARSTDENEKNYSKKKKYMHFTSGDREEQKLERKGKMHSGNVKEKENEKFELRLISF